MLFQEGTQAVTGSITLKNGEILEQSVRGGRVYGVCSSSIICLEGQTATTALLLCSMLLLCTQLLSNDLTIYTIIFQEFSHPTIASFDVLYSSSSSSRR